MRKFRKDDFIVHVIKQTKCGKKCFDRIGALLISSKKYIRGKNRLERKIYYCNICKAFHVTKSLNIR